jgi:hypothetical protein
MFAFTRSALITVVEIVETKDETTVVTKRLFAVSVPVEIVEAAMFPLAITLSVVKDEMYPKGE